MGYLGPARRGHYPARREAHRLAEHVVLYVITCTCGREGIWLIRTNHYCKTHQAPSAMCEVPLCEADDGTIE